MSSRKLHTAALTTLFDFFEGMTGIGKNTRDAKQQLTVLSSSSTYCIYFSPEVSVFIASSWHSLVRQLETNKQNVQVFGDDCYL